MYEPPDWLEQHAIERGDLHDWSELEPVRHAARCVRCQIGVQSAERNAERSPAVQQDAADSRVTCCVMIYG